MYFQLYTSTKITPILRIYRRAIALAYFVICSFMVMSLFAITVSTVSAQSSVEDEDLLPEIDPQDIEIRGDYTAEFQGLTRQPILGFAPEPRVFQIDPERMPFIQDQEDIVATISVSDLEEPLLPESQTIAFPDKGSAFLRAGYGRFDSPYGRLFVEQDLTSNSMFRADSRFSSSGGHDLDHPTEYRSFDVDADLIYRSGRDRFVSGISGYSHFNYTGDASNPNFPADTPPRSEATNIEAKADWQRLYNPYNGWNIKGKFSSTNIDIDNFLVADGLTDLSAELNSLNEQLVALEIQRFFEGQNVDEQFLIEGESQIGFFNNGIEDQNWNYGRLGFSYIRRFAQVHRLKAGLNTYQLFDPEDDLNFRFYPDVTYTYNPGSGINLKIYGRGHVENRGLSMIPESNRMVVNIPWLGNQRGWDIGGNSSYSWNGRNKIYSRVSYSSYDNYPFFRYTSVRSGHELDFANSAGIFEGTIGYATDVSPRTLSLRAEVTARSTSADELDDIPYYEPLAVRIEAYSQPLTNFYLQGTVDFRSDRPTVDPDNSLSGFVLGSIQAEYKISSGFGVYTQVINLFNQEYELWEGYEERPLQILGGITVRF